MGQEIKLRTNFFPVKVPKGPLYEYDVNITPAVSVKRVKRRIFQLAEQAVDWANAGLSARVAHDHASKLIAADKLPQPLVITVPFTDEDEGEELPQSKSKGGKKGDKKADKKVEKKKEYTLTITFVQDLETQSLLKYVTSFLQPFIPRDCAKCLRTDARETIGPSVLDFRRLHFLVIFPTHIPGSLLVLILLVNKLPRWPPSISRL